MPTPEEASALKLAQGVPVIPVLRTVFDAEGIAMEVQDTAGDRNEFRYEVRMDRAGGPGSG
jgi:DNA-binding GntR family transcriptional regulator